MQSDVRYANDLPADVPPESRRCAFALLRHGEEAGADARPVRCGLPAGAEDEGGEPRCDFHSHRPRGGDEDLKYRLAAAAAAGTELGGARLAGAELQGIDLSRARLAGADLSGADLRHCRLGDSELTEATLTAARLTGAQLSGASLARARLEEADLSGAFLQRTRLEGARAFGAILRGAHLREAHLQGALLHGAILDGADLTRAQLDCADLHDASLRGARLQNASLQAAHLMGADLREASLEGARMNGASLRHADVREANLQRAELSVVQRVDTTSGIGVVTAPDLRHADLREVLLSGATLALSSLVEEVQWAEAGETARDGAGGRWRWTQYHLRDERCARSDREWERVKAREGDRARPSLPECGALYRALKLCYTEAGDYPRAGEFYVREMECLRAQLARERRVPGTRAWYAMLYHLCGYGERPLWTAAWAVVLVVVFAFFHGGLGIAGDSRHAGIGPGWEVPSLGGVGRWFTSAYFSAVTFITLGYGDLIPLSPVGRLCAGLEAVCGFLIMSLFMVCLVRRFSR